MKRWQLVVIVLVIGMASGIGGYQFQQHTHQQANNSEIKEVPNPNIPRVKSVIGMQVPDFSLADVDGKQRLLSEWKGKVIAINFWATWCSPCREEIPAFVELQEKYEAKGVQFVGIALQTSEEIKDFLTEFKVNYPALVGENEVITLGKQLGNDIGALPYTVIADREGKIVFTHRGPLLKTEAEKIINTLL